MYPIADLISARFGVCEAEGLELKEHAVEISDGVELASCGRERFALGLGERVEELGDGVNARGALFIEA